MTTVKTKTSSKKASKSTTPVSTGNGVFDTLFSTEIIVLLDRSGSMSSIKPDMEGGFNQLVTEQRLVPGQCDMTLVQFDSNSIDTVYEAKPIKDVPSLVMEPRGGTPLLDAMAQTIKQVETRHAGLTKAPDKVLFLVITDGEENSSKKYKKSDVKVLVETQTAKGWVFSFLGANIDSFAEAASIGITARGSTLDYTPNSAGVRNFYSAVSSSVSSLRTGGVYNLDSNAIQPTGVIVPPTVPVTPTHTTTINAVDNKAAKKKAGK